MRTLILGLALTLLGAGCRHAVKPTAKVPPTPKQIQAIESVSGGPM